MKISHEYFQRYCTRAVTFEEQSGVFLVDGLPLNRSHDLHQIENAIDGAHAVIDSKLPSLTEIHLNSTPGASPTSKFRSRALTTNRLKLPERDHIMRAEQHNEEVNQAAWLHNKIYKDDNFAKILDKDRQSNPALLTGRLIFSSEEQLRSLTRAYTSHVKTRPPPNAQLGLTPLRQYGNGQDKPHHIQIKKL
jgi:hypothetical protein